MKGFHLQLHVLIFESLHGIQKFSFTSHHHRVLILRKQKVIIIIINIINTITGIIIVSVLCCAAETCFGVIVSEDLILTEEA